MKKIKISQLPLFASLKGLYTIGTDSYNRSVKVSLEFIEDETRNAVRNAESATTAAQTATSDAQTATRNAQTATTNANTATSNARTATIAAQTATTNANNATAKANTAAENAKKLSEDAAKKANDAASAAMTAKENTEAATAGAEKATEDAEAATSAAQRATTQTIDTLARLIPTGLKVSAIERITLGNTANIRIETTLTPDGTLPNIIFISDNEAVRIDQKGHIKVMGIGTSEVQIIPTCNTALAKTVIIRVESPTLRLVDTRRELRITESGALLLN